MPLGTPLRRMPIPEVVAEFLDDLLGAGVSADKARGVDLSEEADSLICATYIDDNDQLAGACLATLPFAASTGAALAMMPVAVVDEALAKGALIETLGENFYEVANILTRLLNGPAVPHLRIAEVVNGLSDELSALVASAIAVKHYDVTILGYRSGRVTLVALHQEH